MKKLLYVLSLALMWFVGVLPVQAQGPQEPAQLAYIDAQVDVLVPRLSNFQHAYFLANGRYYQALVSHASVPEVPTVPDGIENSPTDQPETLAYFWLAFAELPEQLGWSFSIDTYSGPDGDGYVLNVETAVNGETWKRAVNYGPDAWRAVDWYLFIPEE